MFVAWRDLRFAKGRFALMGSVIVLITLLVGLLSGLTAGLAKQNVSAVTGLPADHIAFDTATPSYADSTIAPAQWRQWTDAPGVTGAHPLGIATTRAAFGGATVAVAAFGTPPGSGLSPADSVDGGLVLSTTAANDLGAAPGDTIVLGGRRLAVTAVRGDASHSHLPVIWTTLDDWQRVTGGQGATVIALTTTSTVDFLATDAQAGTQTIAKADSLTAIGSYAAENGSLRLMRGFLFAISALVIGAFFTVWTIQRNGDIAVLKALGASTGALLRDALGQAVVLLVGGTLLGAGAAAGIGAAVAGEDVPFDLGLTTTLGPTAVLIALGALGAGLAIRRITAVDPLTALGSLR